MRSDKDSVTVLTHALASYFLSNFFLRFLRGDFLLVSLGKDGWEVAGNYHFYQGSLLTAGAEMPKRMRGKVGL